MCSTYWGLSNPKFCVSTQNLCPRCIRFQNVHSLKKMSVYSKEFPWKCLPIKKIGYIFWGTPKPVIIMTDSKSYTQCKWNKHYWNHYITRQVNTQRILKYCKKSDKILLPINGEPRLQIGQRLSNLCQRQTNWQFPNYTRTHPYTRMGYRSRRRHGNRPFTRTPTKWRLRKDHYSNWCNLKICLCTPRIQSNSRPPSQKNRQLYDKTCVLTSCNDNRKRLSFRLKCDTRNSWSPRYHTPPGNQEECTKYQSPRKNACLHKDIIENVFRRILQIMARISTISNFILQHYASHE